MIFFINHYEPVALNLRLSCIYEFILRPTHNVYYLGILTVLANARYPENLQMIIVISPVFFLSNHAQVVI
jgi:hypothetical protein